MVSYRRNDLCTAVIVLLKFVIQRCKLFNGIFRAFTPGDEPSVVAGRGVFYLNIEVLPVGVSVSVTNKVVLIKRACCKPDKNRNSGENILRCCVVYPLR